MIGIMIGGTAGSEGNILVIIVFWGTDCFRGLQSNPHSVSVSINLERNSLNSVNRFPLHRSAAVSRPPADRLPVRRQPAERGRIQPLGRCAGSGDRAGVGGAAGCGFLQDLGASIDPGGWLLAGHGTWHEDSCQ